MAEFLNLTDPDQHPEKLYADDGLLDILLGAVFFGAALAMRYDVVWLFAILPLALLTLWQSIKERVTAPRLSVQEIQSLTQSAARTRQRKVIVFSLLVGTLLLGLIALFVFEIDAPWMDDLWPFIMMGIGLLVIALPAYAFGARRYYFYASSALVLWLLCYALALPVPVAVALPGVLMLTGGIYFLSNFLRTHPKIR